MLRIRNQGLSNHSLDGIVNVEMETPFEEAEQNPPNV